MADLFDTSGLAAKAASFGASTYDILLWSIALGLVACLIAFFFWYISFKHHVTVRLQTKYGKRILQTMAKTIKRNGVPLWKIRELRKEVTPPPIKAIETLRNGRLYAECYWQEDNPEPVWLQDTNDKETSFQPFVTQERALHVQNQTEALMRKKKGLWEILTQIVTPIALVIMIVFIFALWGDITAPTVEVAKQNAATADANARIADQNARIMAVMMGQLDASQLNITQTFRAPPGG